MSNLSAFRDMIANSELGPALLAASDNGYNVLVGSTAAHPILFNSYDAHPNILNHKFNSTAAGRYQIIHRTCENLSAQHGYTDFEPDTQDEMCTDLINGRGASNDVASGRFYTAVQKCAPEWASLPGGTSGQHQNPIELLAKYYTDAGGVITEDPNDNA